MVFAGQITPQKSSLSPDTLIAQLWNECLGPQAIPFDPDARKALIAHGCKHPDLKRHIEAWQKLKEAAWKVEAGELVFSGIKVNDKPTRTLAKLPAYRTVPTVIRIGKHQYVFSPRN